MTRRRIAAVAAVAYAIASVAYAVPAVEVEVTYQQSSAAPEQRRLAVEVSKVSQLAYQASVPSLAVDAKVVGYTADYGVIVDLARPVAKVEVSYPRPRKLAAAVELGSSAEGWVEVSALPHIARVSAEAVQSVVDLSFLVPTVGLIETSLVFTLEFADAVTVGDVLENVRDLTLSDFPFLDDRLTVSFSTERADSAPALDTVAIGTFKEFADAVSTTDLLGFGLFLNLGIGDWTSPWNGAMFNEYPLHDDNKASIVVVTDHTLLFHPNKALADAVTPVDELQPFFVGKALSDAPVVLDPHVVDFVMAPLSDAVSTTDDVLIGFNFIYPITDAFTSPWNSAPFNAWPFNEQNMGDGLMPSDFLTLHPTKALTDSIAETDAITAIVLKAIADSQAIADAIEVALSKPLADSVMSADALTPFFVGKDLTDFLATSDELVKNILPAGFTDSATTTDGLEIEHIVPAQVIFNSGLFNDVPFN